MEILDFEFDTKRLSDYDCMICHFDGSASEVTPVEIVTFNTVRQDSNSRNNIYGHQTEILQTTIQVCKNPCYDQNSPEFTSNEIRDLMLWLRKNDYKDFILLDFNVDEVYVYEVIFTNISKIKRGGKVVGFELTINTSTSYATTNIIQNNFELSTVDEDIYIANDSDEYGYTYPEIITIKIKEPGNLILSNSLDDIPTIIKNCLLDEEINLDCKNMIITSNEPTHKLYNDFNYHFPRMIRNEDEFGNVYTTSLLIDISISYKLIRKVGL